MAAGTTPSVTNQADPSTPPQRQLSAILYADVHGYSRLMASNEERTYQRLTQSLRLIRALMADYGGHFVRTAGDGVLALFDTAAQALDFAIAIQREFRNETVWNADDEPIMFRIGINLGEVLIGEADIHGHSVNIAARIQALAQPGGICVTEAVQRAVRDSLGLAMRPLGHPPLKNIAEPVELFAIEVNGPSLPAGPPAHAGELLLPPDEASVAVLPLENLSGDARNDHLCDGLAGDIITNLSRFRDLMVIARQSAFLFRNQEIATDEIARQLGVRYLMSGGLQRSGRKVRLRIQLSEAGSGRVVWSERYDGDLGDLFAFQDDVTGTIAARLAIEISAAERRRTLAENAPDVRAYGLILRGQDLVFRLHRETNLHARRLFEEGGQVDPNYARSYAGMARTFQEEWRYRWSDTPELSIARALELAERSIELDPSDARGHATLGYARLFRRQHEDALAAYRQARELNPNDADVLAESSMCAAACGEPRDALSLLKRAMRLNPFYPDWYLWNLGEIQFDLGDYQQAIATLNRMSDKSQAYRLLTASHALLGQMPEAEECARQVLTAQPNFSLEHWQNVPPDRDPEIRERYFEGLRKAGLK